MSIKNLRDFYDRIESHLRSLLALGVNSEQYGPMLIPLIVNKLPSDIRLEISRKLGIENWKIEEFMGILKVEITARENCNFVDSFSVSNQNHKENGNNNYRGAPGEANNNYRRDRKPTTYALLTRDRVLKCCFCKEIITTTNVPLLQI